MTDEYDRLAADVDALDGLPVFVAYNANVDAIVRVDESLESFLDRPDGVGRDPPPSPLSSKEDLATAITHTMAAGRGDEVAMTDSFARSLEANLDPDAQQMGGQAGIMTNLLTALGAAPITYTYLVSERQQSMFTHPERVRYPVVEDGRIRYVPLDAVVNTDRTKINWVFEFRSGDELFGVEAIEDSRFIAASRPPEFDLHAGPLDEEIAQIGPDIDGALLAGYHNLTPEHVDEGYDETLRHARDVLRRLRGSGDVPVHIEYAVTHDEELREAMFEWILPAAHVIGVDTHELALLADDAELTAEEPPREDTPFDPADILVHARMLTRIRERLGVACIRLHAMEYHLAVLEDYLPPEAVARGLEFSAINAATKAARGDIRTAEDLETGLTYEPSAQGREAVELLGEERNAAVEGGRLVTESIVGCPNRVVADPAGTVGIGDIVSSSSFALEVAIANRDHHS